MQKRMRKRSGGGGEGSAGAGSGSGPKADVRGNAQRAAEVAKKGVQGGGESLPYLARIQEAFGPHDVSGVRAHTDDQAQDATRKVGAMAYAQGEDVAFAGSPDLFTAAHEAAHVVQQKSGAAPASGMGEANDVYEKQADEVAERVVSGKSAVDLLDGMTGGGGATEAVQLREDLPRKEVSSKAMARLRHAEAAIEETKGVLEHGMGNQKPHLEESNFNSFFRMRAMRDQRAWILDPSVAPLAREYPDALTFAKAELAQGGNCGENAMMAFDYLRRTAPGEIINRADKEGLDHAFVIIGDIDKEPDDELVVSDPWPVEATAVLWEDFFAYTPDRSELNVRNKVTGDDEDVRAVIAAGLRLSPHGEQLIQQSFDDERVKEEIESGTGEDGWIWTQIDTARRFRKFEYFSDEEEEVVDDLVEDMDEAVEEASDDALDEMADRDLDEDAAEDTVEHAVEDAVEDAVDDALDREPDSERDSSEEEVARDTSSSSESEQPSRGFWSWLRSIFA